MQERTVDDVGDGFEAAVWMPVGATRFVGGVVHLAHLIHVNERVKVLGGHTPEGATHRESFAFVATWGGVDRLQWSRPGLGCGRLTNASKGEGVGGNSRHGETFS